MPRDSHVPRIDYPPVKMVQFSGLAYLEGIELHKRDNVQFSVYGVAKTIGDCFKRDADWHGSGPGDLELISRAFQDIASVDGEDGILLIRHRSVSTRSARSLYMPVPVC